MKTEDWIELRRRASEIQELRSVLGLLAWDQETQLPPKGVQARGRQVATVGALMHERLSAPRLQELLEGPLSSPSHAPDERAFVRNLGREVDRARKIPVRLVREIAEAQSRALAAWHAARETGDFLRFAPDLKTLLSLRREQADALADGGERYDALLDLYEPGMRLERLEPIFTRLSAELSRLVRALAAVGKGSERGFVGRTFDEPRQREFTLHLLKAMGFDFNAGREDRSAHPFTSGLHPTDVRITNRFRPDNPLPAIFGAIHEGGHALYEQGFAPEHAGTPLGQAASIGLHESQSRLWENLIGRSRPFWQAFFPVLRKSFPASLKGVDAERFYFAVNEVEPSPIRVEADEVTYNLHIALRLNLEVALFRGALDVDDLPSAWNAGMEQLLGVRPASDGEGVLQDIHWAWGEFGYFPTYTVGNLYSASLLRAAERAIPDLWEQIRHGQLLELREWLRIQIHARGHLEDAEQTVRAATGEALTEGPFLDYLWTKYGELYGVARG